MSNNPEPETDNKLKSVYPRQKKIKVINHLNLEAAPKGKKSKYWVQIASTGLGTAITVPVFVARGNKPGPVVGLTAVVHGNELNGISVIQKLFRDLDVDTLAGTVVGVLVVNIPGFLLGQRKFNDGTDLNHIMPGNPHGNSSQVYAHRILDRILRHFNYLLDLHTASFGRVNSYYIRADMSNPVTRQMALLQNADIIVHNPPHDGTLRGAVEDIGIDAITLEVGDPNKFQKGMIRSGLTGVYNLLSYLKMIPGEIDQPEEETVVCTNSYWTYTDRGGILSVPHNVTDWLKTGDIMAEIKTIFGDIIAKYKVPEDGIVIGKSIAPVNQTGGRIMHIGIPGDI